MRSVFTLFLCILSSLVHAQGTSVRFDATDKFFLVGDSFTNGGESEWSGIVNATGEFTGIDIFSAGGRNLAQMASAFNSNYNSRNNYSAIVVAGGVNDIPDDRTAAQMQASAESIINGARNSEHIILTTVAPFKGVLNRTDPARRFWTEARQDVADQYDAWVKTAASSSENISVFDIRVILDTDNDGAIDTNLARGGDDYLHPSNCVFGETCGSSVMADAFIRQFSVPEPASLALLAILYTAFGLGRRQRDWVT